MNIRGSIDAIQVFWDEPSEDYRYQVTYQNGDSIYESCKLCCSNINPQELVEVLIGVALEHDIILEDGDITIDTLLCAYWNRQCAGSRLQRRHPIKLPALTGATEEKVSGEILDNS